MIRETLSQNASVIKFIVMYEEVYGVSRDPERFATKLTQVVDCELKVLLSLNTDDNRILNDFSVTVGNGWVVIDDTRIKNLLGNHDVGIISKLTGMTLHDAEREIRTKYYPIILQEYRIMHATGEMEYKPVIMDSLQIES